MKKLINAPDRVVADALRGTEATHRDRVRVGYDPYVIVRADAATQVAQRLLTPIIENLPFTSGDRVLASVNAIGGTPLLELYIVHAEGCPADTPALRWGA